ncbi:MAG: hypothetical protein IT310_00305 [Anaerolineales bacterium]|nr:hypothetical protein [Anaerolineales bacterium]
MNATQKKKRDWQIIILIFPIGILLMLVCGQLGVRLSPHWSVEADMNSALDPENISQKDALVVPPISNDILTPVDWLDKFLTPSDNSGVVFPPFITFEPSLTPTASASPTATGTETPSPSPTVTDTVTPTATTTTPTKKPTDDDTTTPTASPTTVTPTATTTTPTASPTTVTPTATTTTPTATSITSTPVGTQVTATPPGFNVGNPGSGGGASGNISSGTYYVATLPVPIIVNGPTDTNYDLVYYELQFGFGQIAMDSIILSISSDGSTYYEVFNWGDGTPDTNSNVGDVAGAENDNQVIPTSELYGTPPNQTGILIDVDNAPSAPPPGSYSYLAIQAPTPDGDGGLDVDAVDVVDVAP